MDTIWFPDLSTGSGPKYLRLVVAIQKAIEDRQISAGDRLPPVRDLAWQLKVTPGTVARAYSKLTDAGLLEAAVGRGTFVAEPDTARQYTPGATTQIKPVLAHQEGFTLTAVSANLLSAKSFPFQEPWQPEAGQIKAEWDIGL